MGNSFAKLFAKLHPFHHAATLQSPKKLTQLISSANNYEERIASLLKRDQKDKTVLHHAASQSLEHVKVVLESFEICCPKKLDLLKANDDAGKTAFHYATTWSGSTDTLTYLIKQCLESVECDDDRGNYEELCEILNIQDNEGKTALHYAAERGLDYVQIILRPFNSSSSEILELLKVRDKHAATAFHNSFFESTYIRKLLRKKGEQKIVSHCTETLKYLLEFVKHVDHASNSEDLSEILNAQDNEGRTVLHYACKLGLEPVQVVLESFKPGCPEKLKLVKHQDKHGATAFHSVFENTEERKLRKRKGLVSIAINCKPKETVAYLLKSVEYDDLCEILNIQDNEGKTVLHYAAERGLDYVTILLKLFKPGCPQKLKLLKARSKLKLTAFHIAARQGSPETLKYLFKSIDCVDKVTNYEELFKILNSRTCHDKKTVLHCAAGRGVHNVQVILELFKPGCPEILELLKARDRLGKTVFHSTAGYQGNDVLKCLLEAISNNDIASSCKQVPEILNLKDDDGKTVLHCAAERGVHNVQLILELFKPGCPEIFELLKARDRLGKTVFHSAACYQSNDMVKCLSQAISDNASNCKQTHEILNLQDDDGKTALHYAAYCSPESIPLILMFFDTTDSAVPCIWSVKDNLGQTFLSYVTDVETLCIFKDKLSTDMWVELVMNIAHGRSTWLYKMMMGCNVDCLDFILRSLSADVTLQLLKAEDETHSKPLDKLGHEYSDKSTHEFLRKKEISLSIIILLMELVNSFEEENWFFLVESLFTKTVDELHNTHKIPNPANRFIYHLHLLTTVTERVTYEKQLKLLGETNDLDSQLRQQAKSCRIECEESIDRLQEYRTKAKISKATDPNINEQVRKTRIVDIIENEQLTVVQIKKLSPYSSGRYVIPHNQGTVLNHSKSRCFAIILYNTHNRQGAHNEADKLEDSLQALGCEIIRVEWSDTYELPNILSSAVNFLSRTCSLLFLCIMSHGHRGTLSGSSDSEIPVDTILHQLTKLLPKHLPLIIIVQACQEGITQTQGGSALDQSSDESSEESDDERVETKQSCQTSALTQPEEEGSSSDQSDDELLQADPATPTQTLTIHLQRPHTVLLLATVMGSVAYRGYFTGAIADQIKQADGKTDIYTMYLRAAESMCKAEQTPEFRSTMKKSLILPPATSTTNDEPAGAIGGGSHEIH